MTKLEHVEWKREKGLCRKGCDILNLSAVQIENEKLATYSGFWIIPFYFFVA